MISNIYPQQPNNVSDCDENHMSHRGLTNKHFCKNKIQISAIFIFPPLKVHTESISCHSNQSSYPTAIKTQFLCRGLCQEHVYKVQP